MIKLADVDPRLAFGQNVRRRRTALGLSQERLADVCGLHRTYVGGIERGERNVALLNICRIADALDLATSDLLVGVKAEKG